MGGRAAPHGALSAGGAHVRAPADCVRAGLWGKGRVQLAGPGCKGCWVRAGCWVPAVRCVRAGMAVFIRAGGAHSAARGCIARGRAVRAEFHKAAPHKAGFHVAALHEAAQP